MYQHGESWAVDVGKSASHHLSQNEIGSDNPCSQHLSRANDRMALIRIGPTITRNVGTMRGRRIAIISEGEFDGKF
jgi:hypothetical protein